MHPLRAALAFGVAYVALGRLSLQVATVHVSSSPVWPPAGLAIGFLVLVGLRYWPLVLAAAWVVNAPAGFSSAAWIAMGNAGEAAAAAWLVRRAGGRKVLEQIQGTGTLFLAVSLGALISASVGTTTLILYGTPVAAGPAIWQTWGLGNLAGSLLVVPWMLAVHRWHPRLIAEPIVGFIVGMLAFWSVGWSLVLLIPLLAWTTQRPSRTGVAGLLIGIAGGAVAATVGGRGPFVAGDGNESLLLLQLFLVGASLTALILAAGGRQRRSVRRLAHPMLSLAPLIAAAAFVGLILHPAIVSLDVQGRQNQADDLADAWAHATLQYGERLMAVRALYNATGDVDRASFDQFVAAQEWKFGPGGSTAIGFAQHVAWEDVASYEEAVQNDTWLPDSVRTEFHVFPPPSGDAMPVHHVYPMLPQPGAIGLDLFADDDGRRAMEEAARTHQIIATAPKDIISPDGTQPGFFLSLPVDGGFIVLAQTVEDMAVPSAAPYRVVDVTAGTVLHAHDWKGNATHNQQFDAWGRTWLLEMQIPSTLQRLDDQAPWFIVGSGAVLSVAIAATVYAHDSTRARAKAMSQDLVAQARRETGQRLEIDRLRDRDEVRREFLNMVAHELRTPLMPIRTQSYLLRRAMGGGRGLDILDRSVDRLNAVVDDLLDASRLEAKGMELHFAEADIHAICARAIDAVEAQAETDRTQIRLQGPPTSATVDEARIAQIMDNLLSNALKFAPGGHIEVRIHDGDDVVVEVQDDGHGVDPARMDEIGQPFAQIHAPDANLKGTGLGLYICQSIAKLHGGDLTLISEGLGSGSTATLRLPREEGKGKGQGGAFSAPD